MTKPGKNRRDEARELLGERLAGRCGEMLKDQVARARKLGLDESKAVRLSVGVVIPAFLDGRMVYRNGELVPAKGGDIIHALAAGAPAPAKLPEDREASK